MFSKASHRFEHRAQSLEAERQERSNIRDVKPPVMGIEIRVLACLGSECFEIPAVRADRDLDTKRVFRRTDARLHRTKSPFGHGRDGIGRTHCHGLETKR